MHQDWIEQQSKMVQKLQNKRTIFLTIKMCLSNIWRGRNQSMCIVCAYGLMMVSSLVSCINVRMLRWYYEVCNAFRSHKYEAFLAVNCDTILHVVQMEDLKKMVSSTYLILDNGTCTYNKAVCNCNPSTLMYNQINSFYYS